MNLLRIPYLPAFHNTNKKLRRKFQSIFDGKFDSKFLFCFWKPESADCKKVITCACKLFELFLRSPIPENSIFIFFNKLSTG